MINLKNLQFDITTYGQNLALTFSGGSDSSLLFYLAARQILDEKLDINLNLFVTERFNQPVPYAFAVHKRICDLLGCHQFTLTEMKRSELPQDAVIGPLVQYLTDVKTFDSILSGKNKYPDHIRPFHFAWFEETEILRYPFKEYTKDTLIDCFYQCGIEDVLSMTHSCGWQSAGYCGKCFNCQEREWAYSQLPHKLNMGA